MLNYSPWISRHAQVLVTIHGSSSPILRRPASCPLNAGRHLFAGTAAAFSAVFAPIRNRLSDQKGPAIFTTPGDSSVR